MIHNLQLSGNTKNFPFCGGIADLISGRFSYVGGVLRALAEPGVTRAKLEAAKDIAEEASKGTISTDEAVKQLRQISATLATAIEKSGGGRISWELILALLMAIYTFWADQKSDAEYKAALLETRTQTELTQKMLEESQAQTKSLRDLATRPALQQTANAQTNAPRNRHERRKAKALERRKGWDGR